MSVSSVPGVRRAHLSDRQTDRHLGSPPRFARDLYGAAMALDDSMRDGQSETGAHSLRLGGEEGIEDPVQLGGRDARSIVAHADPQAVTVASRRDPDVS